MLALHGCHNKKNLFFQNQRFKISEHMVNDAKQEQGNGNLKK